MPEMKIYTIVVPYDFDMGAIEALLPKKSVWHEFQAFGAQLHSRYFWEHFARHLTKTLFDKFTE